MQRLVLFIQFYLILPCLALKPSEVAVIYNADIPESRELALYYARKRGLNSNQLIGIQAPKGKDISRDDFNRLIREPLRKKFSINGWWNAPIKPKNKAPFAIKESKIKALVCMRGVPFRITRAPEPKAPPQEVKQFNKVTEASVDGDLAALGMWNASLTGPTNNPYFKKDAPFDQRSLPWGMLMVTRIDGPSYEVCERMIDDAIETEKSGLWGKAYIDLSKKYKQGDDWLKAIASACDNQGIPCIEDIHKDTFTSHYPMNDCALYFGWYTSNRNGPLLNPSFRFRKGAVAVHIHSFSAAELRSSTKGWSGPLLAKGAAATVGNVFEPYLGITHHLNILFDRLLKGFSWAEACYMAQPAISWHNVSLGDPLYQPFKHFAKAGGEMRESDKVYRAFRLAHMQWQDDFLLLTSKLRTAASRMKSGTLFEALGQQAMRKNNFDQASIFLRSALGTYREASDKIRLELALIDILRRTNKKREALRELETALNIYEKIPEHRSLIGLRNILNPPPPKPKPVKANQKKSVPNKKK